MSLSIKSIKSLIPLLDRVLVQRAKVVEKTASGLFLPSAATQPMNEAVVIAVGPGHRDTNGVIVPMTVAVGDKVILPGFGGVGLKVNNEDYSLFRDVELLAVIRGE